MVWSKFMTFNESSQSITKVGRAARAAKNRVKVR